MFGWPPKPPTSHGQGHLIQAIASIYIVNSDQSNQHFVKSDKTRGRQGTLQQQVELQLLNQN